jgi:hypothetical protein
MPGQKSSCLFVIIPELYDPVRGYELSTVWPGLMGTYGTDFFCGHDLQLAIEWANELNLQEGHTPEFTTAALEVASGLSKIAFCNA